MRNKTRFIISLLLVFITCTQSSVLWPKQEGEVNYVPRVGYCPDIPGAHQVCEDGCRADQDCPNGGKCCPTACGRSCQQPVSTDPREKDFMRG